MSDQYAHTASVQPTKRGRAQSLKKSTRTEQIRPRQGTLVLILGIRVNPYSSGVGTPVPMQFSGSVHKWSEGDHRCGNTKKPPLGIPITKECKSALSKGHLSTLICPDSMTCRFEHSQLHLSQASGSGTCNCVEIARDLSDLQKS